MTTTMTFILYVRPKAKIKGNYLMKVTCHILNRLHSWDAGIIPYHDKNIIIWTHYDYYIGIKLKYVHIKIKGKILTFAARRSVENKKRKAFANILSRQWHFQYIFV